MTAGYIIHDAEQLRVPVQKVADFLKEHLGLVSPEAKVLRLPARATHG